MKIAKVTPILKSGEKGLKTKQTMGKFPYFQANLKYWKE